MYQIIVRFGKGRVGNNVAANRVLPFPKLMPLEYSKQGEKEAGPVMPICLSK